MAFESVSSVYSQRSLLTTSSDSSGRSYRRKSRQGRYRKGRKLGEGGCGEVYEGIDLLTGGFVAIKEMKAVEAESVCEELNLLKVLSHANIVKLFDYMFTGVSHELTLYLELIDGGSLKDIRQQFKTIPTLLLSSYTTQVLSGLSYLHACNVMHLDLKPANILVSASGVVKIVDFGTSSLVTPQHGSPTSQPYKGTVLYSAPEAIRGAPVLRSDIWSLGVTLIELSTGVHPWSSTDLVVDDNLFAFAMNIGKLHTLPSGLCHTRSAVLSSFVEYCLKLHPTDRAGCDQLLQHDFCNSSGSMLYSSHEASKFYEGQGSMDVMFSDLSRSACESFSSSSVATLEPVTGFFIAAHHYSTEDVILYQSPFRRGGEATETTSCVKGTRDGYVCLSPDDGPSDTFRFNVFLDSETTRDDVYNKVWEPALKTTLSGGVRHVAVVHASMQECDEVEMMLEGSLPRFLEEVFKGCGEVRGACFTATQEKPSLFDVFNKTPVKTPPHPATWKTITSSEQYLELVGMNQLLFLGVDSPIQFCLEVNRCTIFTFTVLYGHQWGYFSSGLSDILTAGPSMTMNVCGREQVRHPLYRLIEEAAADPSSFSYVLQTFRVDDSSRHRELELIEAGSCLRTLQRAVRD